MPRNKPTNAPGTSRKAVAPDESGHAAARTGMGLAAVGLAILDASAGQARPRTIEGVRLPENAIPATSGDHYQDGRALLAAGDTPGAIAAFRAALVDAPQSIDALNGIAVAYDRMGRYDVSRSYYDTALAIDPNAAMVLNNLGYSLYLQGQYAAAIPLLQKATASNDNGARSTGQRVLTLIAARMRETAIASAETETEVAEAAPPQARIEISSNGEQRLVLGAPAPPRELTASLGEAAAQTMVAKPWTAKDDMAQLAQAISTARAARAQAQLAEAQHDAAALQAGLPRALPAGAPAPARPMPGDAPSAPVLANVIAPAPKSARASNEAVVALYVDETPAQRTAAPGQHRDASPATRSAEASTLDATSAWLLAPRRTARPAEASAVVGHEPQADARRTAFDSDDGDLNAFASRMRGVEPPASTTVSTEEAVARLEALILRLRAV